MNTALFLNGKQAHKDELVKPYPMAIYSISAPLGGKVINEKSSLVATFWG